MPNTGSSGPLKEHQGHPKRLGAPKVHGTGRQAAALPLAHRYGLPEMVHNYERISETHVAYQPMATGGRLG
jgi:hypothetical protein